MRWLRARIQGEQGSIAPLVPVMGMIMLLLGGVVIDGSRQLNARARAVGYAEEAARAGASATVQGDTDLELDPDLARARVVGYCDALRADPDLSGSLETCAPDGDGTSFIEAVGNGDTRRIVVRVHVSLRMPTTLLGMVGKDELTASGTAKARPFEGTNQEDLDSDPPPVDVQPLTPVRPPGGVAQQPDPRCPGAPPGTRPGDPLCVVPPVIPPVVPPANPVVPPANPVVPVNPVVPPAKPVVP